MSKDTTYKMYDAVAEWARLFPHNMDKGEGDSDAAAVVRETGGQYKMDILVDDATKAKMIADGIPETSLGYQMFHLVPESGLWRYKAKRPHLSKTLKDKETGEPVVFGPPNVVDYKKIEAGIEPNKWDDQVLIGNGSKVKVKLSIYKNGKKRIIRLESVAVVDLVEYTGSEGVRW